MQMILLNDIVPKGYNYDYIQRDEYLFVNTYDNDKNYANIYAYKGDKSGYIQTNFSLSNGSSTRLISKSIGDSIIVCSLIKHNKDYIFQIYCRNTDLKLSDKNGNSISSFVLGDLINYFEAISPVSDDYIIKGELGDKKFVLLDYKSIKELFTLRGVYEQLSYR